MRASLPRIFAIASAIGFAVAFVLAVGFGAHGSPDKWLVPASGLLLALAVIL